MLHHLMQQSQLSHLVNQNPQLMALQNGASIQALSLLNQVILKSQHQQQAAAVQAITDNLNVQLLLKSLHEKR
jgi:hypothetical protein